MVRAEASLPGEPTVLLRATDDGWMDAGKASENRGITQEAGGEVCMIALEQRGNTGPHRVVPGQWQRLWALSKTGLLDIRRFTSATLREWFGTRPPHQRVERNGLVRRGALTIEAIVYQCRGDRDGCQIVSQKKNWLWVGWARSLPAVIQKENSARVVTGRCRSARWIAGGGYIKQQSHRTRVAGKSPGKWSPSSGSSSSGGKPVGCLCIGSILRIPS